jgi:plastocyanin
MTLFTLKRLRVRSIAVLVVTIVVGAAVARSQQQEGTQQQAAVTKITIDNFSFTPGDVTVPTGTTITWVNHDDVPHTVVSTDKKFKSKALDTDDTFSFTFTQAGTYEYYCSVHPKMTAKVTVK